MIWNDDQSDLSLSTESTFETCGQESRDEHESVGETR